MTFESLFPICAFAVGCIPMGWLASRAYADERLAKGLAFGVAAAILLTLAYTIATGEFLRFGSDAGADSDGSERERMW